MTDTPVPQSAGWRMKLSLFALCASIFCVLWFMVAALGTKFGVWPWQVGLGQMTIGVGPMIAMIALGIALIAQIASLIKAPRTQPFILALIATLLAAFCMLRLVGMGAQASALPPIHDIQTDWDRPIQFSAALMAARTGDGDTNPVLDAPTVKAAAESRWPGTSGRLVSEIQEEAESQGETGDTVYPPLRSIYFSQSPTALAGTVETLIQQRGWDILTATPAQDNGDATVQIEATATSGWFGFKDDIAIRLTLQDGVTRVDMRSISRVGLSDLGANSKRVYGFMSELQDRADGRLAP